MRQMRRLRRYTRHNKRKYYPSHKGPKKRDTMARRKTSLKSSIIAIIKRATTLEILPTQKTSNSFGDLYISDY